MHFIPATAFFIIAHLNDTIKRLLKIKTSYMPIANKQINSQKRIKTTSPVNLLPDLVPPNVAHLDAAECWFKAAFSRY